MANEITAGPSNQNGDIALLFTYPVASPRTYTDADGATQTVVPTPSAGLPAWADDLVTVAEKASMDAGSLVFEVEVLRQTTGMTGGALSTAAKALYDLRKAAATTVYTVRYHQFYGTRIDR